MKLLANEDFVENPKTSPLCRYKHMEIFCKIIAAEQDDKDRAPRMK